MEGKRGRWGMGEEKGGGEIVGEEEWVGRKEKEGITFFQREETING